MVKENGGRLMNVVEKAGTFSPPTRWSLHFSPAASIWERSILRTDRQLRMGDDGSTLYITANDKLPDQNQNQRQWVLISREVFHEPSH
jgi:hypothetical protein